MQSNLQAVFPEEQLNELTGAEVTLFLEEVGKVEVLRLTQLKLSRDFNSEVECEAFDEKNCVFKLGLNSSFDCLPLLNLEPRIYIFDSFKQTLKLDGCDVGYFFFLNIVGNNGTK